jgi:hypothetical protein
MKMSPGAVRLSVKLAGGKWVGQKRHLSAALHSILGSKHANAASNRTISRNAGR